MPLRRLLHNFLHNEQFIQKMSESAPIRFLARISVSKFNDISDFINKMKFDQNGQNVFKSLQDSAQRYKSLFCDEFKKALEENKQKDKESGGNKKS